MHAFTNITKANADKTDRWKLLCTMGVWRRGYRCKLDTHGPSLSQSSAYVLAAVFVPLPLWLPAPRFCWSTSSLCLTRCTGRSITEVQHSGCVVKGWLADRQRCYPYRLKTVAITRTDKNKQWLSLSGCGQFEFKLRHGYWSSVQNGGSRREYCLAG